MTLGQQMDEGAGGENPIAYILQGVRSCKQAGVCVLDLPVGQSDFRELGGLNIPDREPITWALINEAPPDWPSAPAWDSSFIIRNRFTLDKYLLKMDSVESPVATVCKAYGKSLAEGIDKRFGPLTKHMAVRQFAPMEVNHIPSVDRCSEDYVFDWLMRIAVVPA